MITGMLDIDKHGWKQLEMFTMSMSVPVSTNISQITYKIVYDIK